MGSPGQHGHSGCACWLRASALTPVDTGAHLQAPTALTPLQQLRRMAPAPGLQLPDPLRAARQALRDEMVDEQGIASWYGPGLHGRRTASGERFNTHDFTAAHPHYAFGTRLCVLSRDGKAVEVRVNDRGPYAKNRIIDLSRAAARRWTWSIAACAACNCGNSMPRKPATTAWMCWPQQPKRANQQELLTKRAVTAGVSRVLDSNLSKSP